MSQWREPRASGGPCWFVMPDASACGLHTGRRCRLQLRSKQRQSIIGLWYVYFDCCPRATNQGVRPVNKTSFVVVGHHKQTGAGTRLIIEAASEEDARAQALNREISVDYVELCDANNLHPFTASLKKEFDLNAAHHTEEMPEAPIQPRQSNFVLNKDINLSWYPLLAGLAICAATWVATLLASFVTGKPFQECFSYTLFLLICAGILASPVAYLNGRLNRGRMLLDLGRARNWKTSIFFGVFGPALLGWFVFSQLLVNAIFTTSAICLAAICFASLFHPMMSAFGKLRFYENGI